MAEPTPLRGAAHEHGPQTLSSHLSELMKIYAPAPAARDSCFVPATWPRADGSGTLRAVSWW
jgi:hypothetical protein